MNIDQMADEYAKDKIPDAEPNSQFLTPSGVEALREDCANHFKAGHASRDAEVAVLKAKLEKCKEQRNHEIIRRYVNINKANEEIEKYNVELQS